MKYYKVLSTSGLSTIQRFWWGLPQWGVPGMWMPTIRQEIEPCRYGYHLCRALDIPRWVPGGACVIYEAEAGKKVIKGDDKVVTEKARLIREVARLGSMETANDILGIPLRKVVLHHLCRTDEESEIVQLLLRSRRHSSPVSPEQINTISEMARNNASPIENLIHHANEEQGSYLPFDLRWEIMYVSIRTLISRIRDTRERDAARKWAERKILRVLADKSV